MKKYVLVAGVSLFTAAAVMATVLTTKNSEKKLTRKNVECCMKKKECSVSKVACY